jgi:hypothetical protein
MKARPGRQLLRLVHWRRVGGPWRHLSTWKKPVVKVPDQAPATAKASRHAVQLAAVDGLLFALCNDGTILCRDLRYHDWTRIPEVPQP